MPADNPIFFHFYYIKLNDFSEDKKRKMIISKAFKNNDQVVDDWTMEKAENPATKQLEEGLV